MFHCRWATLKLCWARRSSPKKKRQKPAGEMPQACATCEQVWLCVCKQLRSSTLLPQLVSAPLMHALDSVNHVKSAARSCRNCRLQGVANQSSGTSNSWTICVPVLVKSVFKKYLSSCVWRNQWWITSHTCLPCRCIVQTAGKCNRDESHLRRSILRVCSVH